MPRINKYTFILALWLGTIGVGNANKTLDQTPHFGAENQSALESSVENPRAHDPTCVISTFTFRGTYIQILTYSTYGYGPCDPKAFGGMTLPSITASLATLEKKPYYILKGGIMHPTATNVVIGLTAPYVQIGFLKFSVIAETILPLRVLITSPKLMKQGFTDAPYIEYPSIEKSYYLWAPGTEIYELIDSQGNNFVLTSYTAQSASGNSEQMLKQLPHVLTLPPGWSFRTRVLDKVLQIRSKQLAGFTTSRIIDEFGNFYIKE
jgi:hypothetical protein